MCVLDEAAILMSIWHAAPPANLASPGGNSSGLRLAHAKLGHELQRSVTRNSWAGNSVVRCENIFKGRS
jgi:hypothetical protein